MSSMPALLEQTSRTFAISIPFLPPALQRSVTVAYLIFRIVDTIEDEFQGSTEVRAHALDAIAEEFLNSSDVVSDEVMGLLGSLSAPKNQGYKELLENAPAVLSEYRQLDSDSQRIIAEHLSRTARGMSQFLGRDLSGGQIHDLRAYCYIVAGIVGEMCSALFVAHQPELAPIEKDLHRDSAAFGEALQLVNIIRDADGDLHAGRCYLPKSIGRDELLVLAREDLRIAHGYIQALEKASAHPGIVAFNSFNAALANMTLELIANTGVGAKVSRTQVAALYQTIKERISTGLPIADMAAIHMVPTEMRQQ